MTRTLRRPQLPQRLGFDLPDALAGDIEFLTDFLERVLALAADTEPQADDLLFFRRESLQDVRRLVPHVRVDNGIHRRAHPAVLDEVAERRLAVAANRRLERNRIARNGLELLNLFHRD